MAVAPEERALRELERRVERALERCSAEGLEVLGYGEISTVLALESGGRRWACKRLPPFSDHGHVQAYAELLHEYVGAIEDAGVAVAPTTLRTLPKGEGEIVVYCVQPALAPGSLLPALLREGDTVRADALLEGVLDAMQRVITDRRGLDAQASNWGFDGDKLLYFDVTTPLLRDEAGRERLDLELFLASLPALLRGGVRRWMLSDILDKYYDLRDAALDLAGNMYKDDLEQLVPRFAEHASRRVAKAFTAEDAWSYYRGDARMWSLLQRLRRIDRGWQRRIRRRTYPFLLPGRIERHV